MFVTIIIGMGCLTGIIITFLKRRARPALPTDLSARLDDIANRLSHLDTSVDTVAVEVERISEAQRFTAKVLADRTGARRSRNAAGQDRRRRTELGGRFAAAVATTYGDLDFLPREAEHALRRDSLGRYDSMGNTPPSGELRTTGTLEIKDSRTDKNYSVPILQGGVEGDTATRAMDLRQIKTSPDEFGLMTYDPAFMNTASCKSAITFIDGDKGILRYRGYPIEQLAEKATFLEVAWLLLNGELPTQAEYDEWVHDITYHTYVHENIKTFLQGFRYDAHPMSMLCSAVAALSSFYPEAKAIHDPEQRQHLDHPPAREAADARRVLLPPREGSALHLPRQRSELRRELPLDGRADVGVEVRRRIRCS